MVRTIDGSSLDGLMLDAQSARPLYLQLYDGLREMILSGAIPGGMRIPSSRVLSQSLGVSRFTVVTALDQLVAEGYLRSARGSGTYVETVPRRQSINTHASPEDENATPDRFEKRLSRRGQALTWRTSLTLNDGSQQLHMATPDHRLFPVDIWSRLTKEVYAQGDFRIVNYREILRPSLLEEQIARHIAVSRGIRCEPEDVVTTLGAHHAVTLLAELLLDPGDTVAFEGFTHLIPTAAAHEAIRQGFRDLTLIRMTPDLIYDQMIGMGMAKKIVFSYVGNPGVGLLRRARDAIENGFPRSIEVEEHSHAGMANAYEAGAAGLPCAVFRGYRGAGLAAVNPNIRSVTCPFTGEVLAAVPSIRPDVTFIHAQKADRKGNVLVEGIIGIQKEAVLAAKRAVVTVEEVVDNFDDLHPNLTVLPRWTIAAISVVPGGSHPSYAHGYYARDNAAYLEWDEIAADRDRFQAWMRENVLERTADDFAARVEHLRKAA